MSKKKQNKEKYFCKTELLSRGWTKKMIDALLPAPALKRNPHYLSAAPMQTWPESIVLKAEKSEEYKLAHEKNEKKREEKRVKKENREKAMYESVESLIPENPIDEYPLARNIKRNFILHVGPTNSGKTHDSLERLKKAECGAYLGPLRLLALEIYDRFTADGIPCSMVTGEEMINTPDAKITSSTIEMMDTSKPFDVVVIDEVQMIADPHRGHNWTKAILGLCAKEIHLCMAPEAENIAIQLIKECEDTYEVIHHKRATALKFDDSDVDLSMIQPGDALIVFSRRAVLSLAADLENAGIKTSVIYGNLPPASRREQVKKFTSGETKVVVSTDAIGMGINLPIRRVIFMETQKYDGKEKRKLLPEEIKQIAGRAGRYGMYDEGYVLAIADKKKIESALTQEVKPISKAHLGFGESLATLPYPLPDIAHAWGSLEPPELYQKMDLSEMLDLYFILIQETHIVATCAREQLYRMITCSIDAKNSEVVDLWLDYCRNYDGDEPLRFPYLSYSRLEDLETGYKCLDLYYQFSRRMSKPYDMDRLEVQKMMVEKMIGDILRQQKINFRKTCKRCKKKLPFNFPYGMCEQCYEEQQEYDFW